MEVFQAGLDKEQVKYLCCCFWIRHDACKKFIEMINFNLTTPPPISLLHPHMSQTLWKGVNHFDLQTPQQYVAKHNVLQFPTKVNATVSADMRLIFA